MSLMHPTTGEMLDRLVLLVKKVEYCKENSLPFGHFDEERAEIRKALCDTDIDKPEGGSISDLIPLIKELKNVHEELWVLVPMHSTQTLLDANKRRHAIREEIDRKTGEYKGGEKV